MQLTQYFQVCVASPSAHIIFSRAYSLGLSYNTSHSSFIMLLLLERRTVCSLHTTKPPGAHLSLISWSLGRNNSNALKHKCGLIVKTLNCLKPGFSSLPWGSWSMLCQGTPVAAKDHHSQVGLLRNVVRPVHRLLTSFAMTNVLPCVQRIK